MTKQKNIRSVLVVAESRTTYSNIKSILPVEEFKSDYAKSCGDARRLFVTRQFDILIIDMPLPDEHGLLFAKDYTETSMGIMLITPSEIYDAIAVDAEDEGIVALSKPCPPAFVYVAAKMMCSLVSRLEKMADKNKTLQEKMADIRIVNKAKWALIEKRGMAEGDAHKMIEKTAMKNRITLREAAENIIESL